MRLTIGGARLEWTIEEIERSIEVLRPRFTMIEAGGGWSEELKDIMIASYREVLFEIRRENVDRSQYKSWIRGLEDVDKEALRSRTGATTGDDAVLFLVDTQSAVEDIGRTLEMSPLCNPSLGRVMKTLDSTCALLVRGEFLDADTALDSWTRTWEAQMIEVHIDEKMVAQIRLAVDSISQVVLHDQSRERLIASR